MLWLSVYAGVLGACIGSFLNVVIYRLPRRLPLIALGSRCPHCEQPLPWRYKVPLLSYLWLRGRCAYCHHPIALRYLIVETATAVLFAVSILLMEVSTELVRHLLLLSILLAAAEIDRVHRIIPNKLLLTGALGGLLVLVWAVPSVVGLHLLIALAAVLLGVLLRQFTLWIWRTPGIGMGDVKLIGMVALFLGDQILGVVYLAFLFGGLYGLVGLLLRHLTRRQRIPFGPFIALATVLYPWCQRVFYTWVEAFLIA